MLDFFKNLNPQAQGSLIFITGITLFLNSLGIVSGLNFIIFLISLAVMWYGFVQSGLSANFQEWFLKK